MVGLPHGSTKVVTCIGNVKLTNDIVPRDVLYVPDFKRSLLSISKVLSDTKPVAYFPTNAFLLQDPISKGNVVEGYQASGLYKLDTSIAHCEQRSSSFNPVFHVSYMDNNNF